MSATPTTIDPQRIQAITREVLARLRGETRMIADSTPSHHFMVSDRVVTLASLTEVPAGTLQIEIPSRAIVTPAVVDECKRRGWDLLRSGSDAAVGRNLPSAALLSKAITLVEVDQPGRGEAVARQLANRGIAATVHESEPHQVADVVLNAQPCGTDASLVLADLPAVVVCHACRQPSIRAAMIHSFGEIERLEKQLQPNVWVLDMSQLTLPLAVALAQRCVRTTTAFQGAGR